MSGIKHDSGKSRWDLLQLEAIDLVAKVCGFGAAKYGEDNWRLLGGWRRRYLAAAFRHLKDHVKGGGLRPGVVPLDDESGLPHLAHAAWNCLTRPVQRQRARPRLRGLLRRSATPCPGGWLHGGIGGPFDDVSPWRCGSKDTLCRRRVNRPAATAAQTE